MADELQFDKAEFEGGERACASCQRALTSPWFTLGPHAVCASCREALLAQYTAPLPWGTLARAVAAGVGVATACAVGWAVIRQTTGYELGIVAIGVGWAVGATMRRLAGRGALPLQVVSVLATYCAITLSNVPSLLAGTDAGLVGWIVAVPLSLALPLFVWKGGVSAVFWYIIVAIAIREAWRQARPPELAFSGPIVS
jgi:hypothetical protein